MLTERERERIAEILGELCSTIDDFFGDARAALSCDEWALLVAYATARMRRVLEVGTSLHAVVDAHEGSTAPFRGRGRDAFVRAALRSWSDCYPAIPDPWRLSLFFDRVTGGERRVLADVATLEAMAANRLFTSLDDECDRLLTPDR